jgi:molybdopterin molybdotransferase
MIGTLGEAIVIGLPGNPVSAFVTATLFLKPLIAHLLGAARPTPPTAAARLGGPVPATGNRAEYLRGKWVDGRAVPLSGQDSAGLAALVEAELLIVRRAGAEALAAGAEVEVITLA